METIIAFYSRSIPRTSVVAPDRHHFCNLDPHPDPDPHQLKIRIRIPIKVTSWIREPSFGSQDLDLDPHQSDADPQHCQELATGNITLD